MPTPQQKLAEYEKFKQNPTLNTFKTLETIREDAERIAFETTKKAVRDELGSVARVLIKKQSV